MGRIWDGFWGGGGLTLMYPVRRKGIHRTKPWPSASLGVLLTSRFHPSIHVSTFLQPRFTLVPPRSSNSQPVPKPTIASAHALIPPGLKMSVNLSLIVLISRRN
jgi:hypothetical protein